MQLINTLSTQLLNLPEALQTSFQDIVHQVEIQSRHCIKHPNYKPLELPDAAVSRFQQLPVPLQNTFLGLQLRSFLYGIYYNGSLKRDLALEIETDNLKLSQNLENNTYLGVDVAFYDRLHENNNGEGYLSYNWLVVKEETDGALAVEKNDLTLHIERDTLLHTAAVGDLVTIKMPKNLVQNGFYKAVSNAGMALTSEPMVRVYFNVTPDGALAIMDSLTSQLNALAIAFSFKALYNPADYDRYDSAVLYFNKINYEIVYPVLKRVYADHQAYFQEEVPLLTKFIAPGLAIAEEPTRKFGEHDSFGTNRCQVIANGLLEAWLHDNDTPTGRLTSIFQHCAMWKIDLQRPYLDGDSVDIYSPV